jgi:hypothetical protein
VPDEVSRALHEDERVLWSGRSVRAARWNISDTACAGFLLFVLSFASLWQAAHWFLASEFPLVGVVVPAVFTAIFGRHFVVKRRRRDQYVLTNHRLLTVTRAGIEEMALRDLPPPIMDLPPPTASRRSTSSCPARSTNSPPSFV